VTTRHRGISLRALKLRSRLRAVPAVSGIPLDWQPGDSSALAYVGLLAGTCLVTLSYVAGRAHSDIGSILFWAGEVGGFVTLAWRLGDRDTPNSERATLILLAAICQSVLTYAYSPIVFRFPDELQHWRTAVDILQTHHLFTPNLALPVSPEFPALEIVTVAVVSVFHLPLFYSALLVAAAAHALLALAAFGLFRAASGSPRLAGVAAALFGSSPHAFAFNTLYLYGAIALPFFVLAVRSAFAGVWETGKVSIGSGLVGAMALCTCIVAHPLTAFITLAFCALITILVPLLTRRISTAVKPLTLTVTGVLFALAWVTWVGRDVVNYLQGPLSTLIEGLQQGGAKSGEVAAAAAASNSFEKALVYLSVAITGVVLPIGIWLAVLRRRGGLVILSLLGITYYVVIAVRLLDANGAELATRGLTYVSLFSAPALALFTIIIWQSRRGALLGLLILVALFTGSLASGWPPSWERLPGRALLDGFDSGVDAGTLSVSAWASEALKAHSRIACDFTQCATLAAFANLAPVPNAGSVYAAGEFSESVRRRVAVLSVSYLVLDDRLAEQVPVTGSSFATEKDYKPRPPLSSRAIQKFRSDSAVSTLYDDGQYRVFDVFGLWDVAK